MHTQLYEPISRYIISFQISSRTSRKHKILENIFPHWQSKAKIQNLLALHCRFHPMLIILIAALFTNSWVRGMSPDTDDSAKLQGISKVKRQCKG